MSRREEGRWFLVTPSISISCASLQDSIPSFMAISIRSAFNDDIPAILSIMEYYVRETVVTFLVKQPPMEYIHARLNAAQERGLPYLVATTEQSGGEDKIVGYAYASAFRGFMLGYGATVEMSIFCHPEHTREGVGSAMMKALLQRLRKTRHTSREVSHEQEPQQFEVKQVLAVMAVDDQRADKGLGLRDWYQRWGFEQVGHLRKVGWKKGRWYVFMNGVLGTHC